ncbi:hypothetical protein [Chitinophaga filiformis]|uniref:DUF4836 domain-containing protein n=1 Tax=Chitinophaga filiformis TaxID=104663 RepID=A0A1G7PAX5_CHIFI|nr:hypothetical protein [Chitinophaga filiformis]SDF83374.1 hypothetical protein SAMN04488121_1021124 [Chitinophaga filiformis]
MKRLLQLVTLVTCASYTATAQDLAYKIPEKAFSVLSVKSDQLFKLYPATEFNNSTLGKKLLAHLSKTTEKDYKSIEDLGMNLSSSVYYYYNVTDSINCHSLLIPLADSKKINALFAKQADSIWKVNGVNILPRRAQKTVIAWNDQFLYLTYGSVNTYFLKDSATAVRYGMPNFPNEGYYYYDDGNEAHTDVVTPLPIDTSATDIILQEGVMDTTVVEDRVVESMPPVAEEPSEDTSADETAVEDAQPYDYDARKRMIDSIGITWLTNSTQRIFEKRNTEPSVLNNPSYLRSADNNAVATYWMADLEGLYTSFIPYKLLKYGNMMRGYGNVNARLYMGKENIRLTSEMGLDAEKSAMYERICDHKINKDFLKYIKSDSLIGFMSYSFNTEAYMNEMPKLLMQTYGGSRYSEEMAIAADLISVMLDEKAIAQVVKGDALFLLTNLSEKQVTYQSYNYNEETFEYKDTVMTKTETLPDFLFMLSSDDTRLFERLLNYGIKKEQIALNNGIYSITQSKKNPFSMHVLIKDGIVFLGTSLVDLTQIRNGSFKGSLDKQHKELLTKNNLAMFFSPKGLSARMPTRELEKNNEKISKLLAGAGNVYLTSAGIKDGYISGDLTIDVPKGEENALKYFLNLIEEMDTLK